MRALALLILMLSYSRLAISLPPIEGGKKASLSSFDYVDVLKITNIRQGNCTGTRVKENLLLTAAHCVLSYEQDLFSPIMKVGNHISMMGKIKNIHVHPDYKKAERAYHSSKTKEERIKNNHHRTLVDIALIETETNAHSKRTMPYPKIINEDIQFDSRRKIELAGYGATSMHWNGSDWQFSEGTSSIRTAANSWVNCPQDFFSNDLEKINKLARDVYEALQIKAIRTHEIKRGVETIIDDGNGMILSGDSGSPSLERDSLGNLVVTGVASNITPFGEGSGNAIFEIYQNGVLLERKEVLEFPENWGDKYKLDSEFPEVKQVLKEKGLFENDFIKEGVEVKRIFTRANTGFFSDLSHPVNQDFIKGVFKKTP